MSTTHILIVTHAQLTPEFGAGQMAINLAEALRQQGNQVTLWSPHPLPDRMKWWQSAQIMRQKLNDFLDGQTKYDILDSPAVLITPKVRRSASLVVARSVQPDILYIFQNFRGTADQLLAEAFKLPFYYLYLCYQAFSVLKGWQRSSYILCLGTLELQWMRRWFPWWKHKLLCYVNALSKSDQSSLSKISLYRKTSINGGIRFLWIGRWTHHKGIDILSDFITQWAISHPEDTYTIAGCGPQAEKKLPAKLVQAGIIRIIPNFDRSQLFSLLEKHDVGLFTSRVEGWGLVLNEMLESGMPVFATKAGGVVDLMPYVKKGLGSFPPSLGHNNDIHKIPVILASDYYQQFTWENIAKEYQDQIVATLDKNKS